MCTSIHCLQLSCWGKRERERERISDSVFFFFFFWGVLLSLLCMLSKDKESVYNLVKQIDKSNGYIYGSYIPGNESLFTVAEGPTGFNYDRYPFSLFSLFFSCLLFPHSSFVCSTLLLVACCVGVCETVFFFFFFFFNMKPYDRSCAREIHGGRPARGRALAHR